MPAHAHREAPRDLPAPLARERDLQASLDEAERRLRQAEAFGRLGSWEWDAETGTMTWSQFLFELYGVDPDHLTAEEANRRCVQRDDREATTAAFRLCAQTGSPVLLRYHVRRLVDSEVRVFEARAERLPGTDECGMRVAGITMDVTDQVRALGEATNRDAMLRAIIANSASIICVKDLAGRYVLVNQRFEQAFLVAEADLLGQDDTYLDPAQAPTWRANDRRAQEGQLTVEEWSDRADGRHYYECVKFPLFDPDGRLHGTCGVSFDVTARRRTADALLEARDAALAANAAKSSFLAIMSHEIRTPMNAVIGMTDLLLTTDLDSHQHDYLETIRTSGDALLAVINNVLDFSRIEAGGMDLEFHPFDLRRCVEDTLKLLAGAAEGLQLIAHVDADCPQFVRGDENRLRQVLLNLVGNAVKFTERGHVLISVSPPHRDQPRDPHADESSVELVFSVRDTGIGIPPERLDRLFKSFSQVDASTTRIYGGSGLGLAISRALVQAMGADISVTSEVGVGSTFAFTLSLGRGAGERPDNPPETSAPELIGRRVLIVDGDDTTRRILLLQLESWGMICIDVAGPAEALAIVQGTTVFDLALLDLNTPGMDGVQLAERLRSLPGGRDLPLVLLSGLESSRPARSAELFAGFHTKPIRSQALRAVLGEVLAPKPAPLTPPVPSVTPAAGLRVLLAEDNLVNQKVAQGMLQHLGHSVVIADHGQAALEALQKDDYDVVLMDINMPTMDGLTAARAIRAQIPLARQPRIVAMTASALPEDRRACAEAGMDDYLLKPVRAADLAEALAVVAGTTVAALPSPRRPDVPSPP